MFFAAPCPARAGESKPLWYSVPIAVTGLPRQGEFVPIITTVDLSALLARAGASAAPDERLLRLYHVKSGTEQEIPVQFICDQQPRPGARQLLPGTPQSVSYVAEWAAGTTPPVIGVRGEMTWIAQGPFRDTEQYLLRMGVRGSGRMIQVPFPPQNLRGFDNEGRGTPVRWFPKMRISPQWPFEGVVHIYDLQQLVSSYHTGPWLKNLGETLRERRPFFYPVNGPDGIPLTEFGKPHDPTGSHAHHYSLWIAHASVDGHDFWSEKGGIIAHEQFDLMEDGPIFCRLEQKARWMADGNEVLREKRGITVYQSFGDFRVMDLDLEYAPAAANPVTFGKTSFGLLAARVAQSMTPFDGGGEIRNSEGDLNEKGTHFKHARWIDQSGPSSPDRWGGIAILDNPQNPNYPTVWHCRNDGWAGASFNADQPYTLEPGKTLRLKYRVQLHRGNALQGQVEIRFQEYTARPDVAFGSPKAQQ